MKITEADVAQFPMVRHAEEIGWKPIPPDAARQKRGGETGMLFRGELEARLAEFNLWMLPDAIRQVVERIEVVCSPKTGPVGMLVSWNVRESRPERLRTTVRFLSSKMEVRKSSAEWERLPDGSHQEVL